MIKMKFNTKAVENKIKRMILLSNDIRPLLLQIRGEPLSKNTNTVIGGINAQFITQGQFFSGKKWPRLTTSYAKWKRRHYPSKTMLRKTDKLFKSVTVPGSKGNVQSLSWTRLTWGVSGSTIPYARRQNRKRRYIGFTKGQKDIWSKLTAQYLLEVKRG